MLRERVFRLFDYGSPFYSNEVHASVRLHSEVPVTMIENERSFRYPWPVRSVEQLASEMDRAYAMHGRIGVCGWKCTWLPGEPVLMWDEAKRLVDTWAAQKRKDEKTK